MDSQPQTGKAFQDLVVSDEHSPELNLGLQEYYLLVIILHSTT